jgi:hypothetical protein
MAISDALRICSDALTLLGEEPLTSFDIGTTAAVVANQRYAPFVAMLLADHPWTFNRRLATLNRFAAAPAAASGYPAAYALPADCYGVIVPYVDETEADEWDIIENQLLLDADADSVVSLRYHGLSDETTWAPLFREAVVYGLAAEWALSIRESAEMADRWAGEHMKALLKAKHKSGLSQPQRPIRAVGRLAGARRG